MAFGSLPSSKLSCLASRYKDYFLTNASSMVGAYELGGNDPTGLGDMERRLSTALLRSIIRNSHEQMTLTQYYIHQYKPNVSIRSREDKRSNFASKRREVFLTNKRKLSSSRVFFLVEHPFARDLTRFRNIEFLHNLVSYPVSKVARNYVKTRFSERKAILAYEEDIKESYEALKSEIEYHLARLDLTSFGNQALSGPSFWGLIKSLHTFDFDYLNMGLKPPIQNLNNRVFDSEVSIVNIKGIEYLKISGLKPIYIRFASVKGFSDESIREGLLSAGLNAPLNISGNYVIMNRYRGLDRRSQQKHFNKLEDDVSRNNLKFLEMLKGDFKSAMEQKLMMTENETQILQEIERAQSLADNHGVYESNIAVFSEDIEEINVTCKALRVALGQSGVDVIWERTGLENAFESFLPGSQYESKRSMVMNTTKAAALSLNYKSSQGIPIWKYETSTGSRDEEAFYIFESNDGVPFYYTPYIGGRCMIVGVGPIRSGKTFMKNTIATHFFKFGGYYNAIDIDPGTETIAKFFQDDGGIFRLDEGFEQGFNPFAIASGEKDTRFRAHFVRQLEMMLQSNSNDELKKFTKAEQKQVDDAILATLKLPPIMRSFSYFLDHCNNEIQLKLARFSTSGMYEKIYMNDKDAIGSLEKRFSVYNLMGAKNDPVSLPLVMSEIVYRILNTFENPETRDRLKMLDVDECHQFLKIPGMTEFLVSGIRTWGKFNAGLSLWTQSPKELKDIKDWSAIRSAATTFFFMADAEMDRDVYRDTFNLSEGHLDAIESLSPKKQAFIYQPEIRVAKIINLNVEPEQHVINTSVAGQVMMLKRNLNALDNDIDAAIQKTVKELNLA